MESIKVIMKIGDIINIRTYIKPNGYWRGTITAMKMSVNSQLAVPVFTVVDDNNNCHWSTICECECKFENGEWWEK